MPAGRPKKGLDVLPEGWQAEVVALGKEGASQREIQMHLDISEDLFYRWMAEEEEFSLTIKKALAYAEIWWEKHGRRMATEGGKGNPIVWIFNMKNRFKWKDKHEEDAKPAELPPIIINTVASKDE